MPKVNRLIFDALPLKRRLAVSDIHGCLETFLALLEGVRLKKKDQLFIVGDAINRGPNSAGVLDLILSLKEKQYQVFYLRGNHEQIVLKSHKNTIEDRKKLLKSLKSKNLLKAGEIKAPYLTLLKNTYHYVELPDYYLVHGGFNLRGTHPFEDIFSMMNMKRFEGDRERLNQKTVITGHSPTAIGTITNNLQKNKASICIDNGCVNTKKGQGNLLCLELNSQQIILQKNIEAKKIPL